MTKQSEAESTHAALKDRVRRLLLKEDGNTTGSRLRIIHRLQSLGIAYHFEEEIKGILIVSMHLHAPNQQDDGDLDLHSAALLFRMLRGQGIPASADMLESAFREDDKQQVDSDTLLALYEASYLAFPGETSLEEARAFAVHNLAADQLPELPLHWRAPRLQAMLSLRKEQEQRRGGGDDEILQLARVDFNLVQALHRGELAKVTTWWKESGLGEKLAFARDRVVECFSIAACIAPEPHLADCREVLAKTASLIVLLDDIYDVHGTPGELQAFTDAIGSWEHCGSDAVVALPEYMKAMYAAIWETSTTAAERVLNKQGYHVLPLYKKQWHELCKAFLVEARWHQQSYRPSIGEYLSNGWVTSTGPLLLLHALPAAGITITQQQQLQVPRLVELSSTIFRLCNDCASHDAESERGDAPSSIACCMAEVWCAGEEQARAAVQGLIADTWEALNREVSSADQSMAMANLCLNLARVIHCIYQDGDGMTSPTHRTKNMVKDLLFNPILC